MKKVYLLMGLIVFAITQTTFSQCTINKPNVFSIEQTEATFNIGGATAGETYYIEVGPDGFTPGTDNTPGVGGTLLQLSAYNASVTVTGLSPYTMYNAFARKTCSGSYSANSLRRVFTTAYDCSSFPAISAGNIVTLNHAKGTGAWNSNNCYIQNGITIGLGVEQVFTFTPTHSGVHKLFEPINTSSAILFSYKPATGTCDDANWTCIGSSWSYSETKQFTFGPLTAGTTYWFMVDPQNSNDASGSTSIFRIENPYCAYPGVIVSNISSAQAQVIWGSGTGLIEYGPAGFTPGINNNPGVNGTMMLASSGNYITGLVPDTEYDVYVRRSCGGGLYSANSDKVSFTTLPCPPVIDYWQAQQNGNIYLMWYGWEPSFYNHVGNCFNPYGAPTTMNGGEYGIRFLPPSSGTYELEVYSDYGSFNYNYEIGVGNPCDMGGAGCLVLQSVTYLPQNNLPYLSKFNIVGLTANNYADIFVDVDSTFYLNNASMALKIKCPTVVNYSISNIQPSSVDLNWTCYNCNSNPYIEYGPAGFIPGTGSTAGTNGTLITNAGFPPYTVSGLNPGTKYDFYLRNSCGTMYSSNSEKKTIRTAEDCSVAPVVNCGDLFQYCVSSNSNPITGSWETYACQGTTNQTWATEKIWKFTPSVTGIYQLYNYDFSPGSTGYFYSSHIYIKEETLGCNELNWNCIATLSYSFNSFTPQYYSLGTLDAGTTYYILVDGVQPTFSPGYCYRFQMVCPDFCSAPNLTSYSTYYDSATINAICPSCSGTYYVEYGPVGFNPGTDENPGDGTVLSNVTFPVTITGLNNGETYQVYARQDCGIDGFSSNSNMIQFTPCVSVPTGITSTIASGDTICEGTGITLTQFGGQLPPGGTYEWYAGSCGTPMIGTGNSITVFPTQNTTYRVRADYDACANYICTAAFTINVVTAPLADIIPDGPTTFCDGDSVLLTAPHGSGLTYEWFLDGNLITTATTDSLVTSIPGVYTVTVSNNAGCSKTSDPVIVTVNPNPVVSFSGLQPTYTDLSPPSTLTGTPTGGTFSGPGVNGNTFDPANAGIGGPYTIIYDYTDINGCKGSNSQQTTVTGCPAAVLLNVTTTHNSATIDGSCPSCIDIIIEYGPSGFTPGTDGSAGAGGTLINNASFPLTINGLVTGTSYDVYARNNCGAPNGYSANSNVLTFTPCFTAPTGIATSVPGNSICIGGDITLTQTGGVIPPGGNYFWYADGCGSTPVGTGNSIIVAPVTTTSYWVRIESSCGVSTCAAPVTVTVNDLPQTTVTVSGITTFCAGSSVDLSVPFVSGTTYQWLEGGSPLAGALNAVYTATATGNYSVQVTNANGCSATSIGTSVTVNPLPVVSFSGLLASYTDTSPSSTLTGTPAGGTFSGLGISGIIFDPVVAGTGGPYTITYTYTDGNGCTNSTSQQTSVSGCTSAPAQPGIISVSGGSTSVCPGESRTFSIASVPGSNYYSWTPPAGATITSGQTTLSVTVLFTSGYTAAGNISVTAVNNCGSSTARTLNIQRNNPAMPGTITGEIFGLCNQNGVPYSVPSVSGISFNWSLNNSQGSVVSGQGTNAITVNFSASFINETISVTASNSCGASSPRTLNVNAVPATPLSITGPVTVCSGQQGVPYSITPLFGANEYKWSAPKKSTVSDGNITSNNWNLNTPSANVFVNYGNKTGTVEVYGINGCGSGNAKSININFNCREAFVYDAPSSLEVSVYPNPAQNEINISINKEDDFEIELQNMLGELIMKRSNEKKIDITSLPGGIYLMKIIIDDQTFIKKVNIEK